MKKFIFLIVLLILSTSLFAQSDTTIVTKPITFDSEVITSKTGKEYTKYYVVYNNEYYESTKQSFDRYYLIKRFGGTPCVVLITTGKTKKQKIIIL